MTAAGPPGPRPPEPSAGATSPAGATSTAGSTSPAGADAPAPPQPAAPQPASPAVARAAKLNAANMLRSLLPLVVLCVALVAWQGFQERSTVDPVTVVDPSASVRTAAERAGYPLVAPSGLPEGYRPTSARTDGGAAAEGDPVTLEIGYLTPSEEFAGFVIGDDPRAGPLATVLDDAQAEGTVELAGETWTRLTSARGETVLTREVGDATALVTGSASDEELGTVAGSLEPWSG